MTKIYNGKTKFIKSKKNPIFNYTFERMSQKISNSSHISPVLVKKYGKKALLSWEIKTGKELQALSRLKSEDRSAILYDILADFRHSLEPIALSAKNLDRSMCIASVSLELIFRQ